MANKNYILLKDLEVYQLARKLSQIGWSIYINLDWQTKKIIGDQFIEATDSSGANIAEGYQRFHFLDRIKFYYNARASLSEANEHWLDLLKERNKVNDTLYNDYKTTAKTLSVKLNNFIAKTYENKNV